MTRFKVTLRLEQEILDKVRNDIDNGYAQNLTQYVEKLIIEKYNKESVDCDNYNKKDEE